ncbi:MAG: hypothetical protein A2900_05680 [Candidatus Chisholmbacteria bacterium RIFCSPLOWO2_01_FULL_50_28]|uniref:S1 motif domain-containing protein n=1 Tax=Candidatus Chisholmbacteria bacterium RIFCSPHIGHO2_01_FULL_52_32 TaxID=1797591 RepID=A0A1G1VRS1_9BACT|nr:MAG: hypothetical protein A2786_01065 [Candidatus Chisholmbacteria bacterium RIFCSPHIGHO2_01_FULL_52_32]OGY20531.1 MAG: hypothetical protein A2900_05680 [Candidatus Chisholmbacteria bacterium RIFCSPLOWO2_01_FULL_50_28]
MAKKAKASKKTPKRSRGKIPKKAKTPAKKSVKTAGRMKTAQKASLSSSGKAPLTAETGAATQATLKKTPVPVKPGKVTPAKPRGKEPVTMEELLAQTGYELHGVKRGELIEGTVTDISKRMVLVDIGGKTEGLVVDKEYEAAREFIRELAVGDAITVYVLSPENDRGQILLSLKKAASDRTWEKFEEAEKTGEIMTVRGLEVNQGGVIVHADSVQGFVPSSQFGRMWMGKMEELVGKSFQVQVIEVDREKNRLIFSEKQVSEAEELKKRAEALKQIQVGASYDGSVSGIVAFGMFVTVDVPIGKLKVKNEKLKVKGEKTEKKQVVGKVEGLVHISEISWEKVDDTRNYFKVGANVKVKVLGIDAASGKLNLSVKQLTPDPWEGIEEKYPSGKKFKGKVSRVAPFGAFVTLEPGIEGLLHISKIPAGGEPEDGQNIEVYIEQVDREHRRMSLGMVLTEVPVGYK